MEQKTSRDVLFYWLLFLINYPLLSEVIRRFIYYSDLFFVLGDFLILGTLLFCYRGAVRAVSLGMTFYLVAVFLLAWGLASALNHGNPMITLVGARAIFVPFFYIFVSGYFFRRYEDSLKLLVRSVAFWCVVISAVALAQVYLGRENPINALPDAIQATGIGDFTVESEGLGLDYMFRPTSIFLHTGKFGQIIFVLVLFKWVTLLLYPPARSRFLVATIPMDLIGIIVSGQRGTYLFLTLSMLFVYLFYGLRSPAKVAKSLMLGASLLGLVGSIWFAYVPEGLRELLLARYLSSFKDVFLRINENLVLPLFDIVHRYGVIGEGMGYFTLGAARFGGAVLYETVTTAGVAENSWLRLIAEMGLLAAALFAVMLLLLVVRAIRISSYRRVAASCQVRAVAVFFICWLVSISMWAITHDVFSNSTMMSIGFMLGGPAFLRWHYNSKPG